MWHRAHCVVRDACGVGTANPRRVGKERVQTAVASLNEKTGLVFETPQWLQERRTYVVQINVDAAVMGKYEIPDGVRALNGLTVIVERAQEPRVFGCDELAGFDVGP